MSKSLPAISNATNRATGHSPRGRTMLVTIVAVLAALSVRPGTAMAQQEFLSMAPVRYTADVLHAPDLSTSVFFLGFERSIPVANLLPQVSPDSFLDFIRAQAGIRVQEDGLVGLRAHVTAASLEIQKQPWSASFSLLDINAADVLDLSADWLSLGLGPGFDVGSRELRVVAKVLARGALNSSRFGETPFPEVGSQAGIVRHTATYGLHGTAGIVARNRGSLLVRYGLSRYAIDAGIEQKVLEALLSLNVSRKVQFIGSYRDRWIKIDEGEDDISTFGFGIRFTPEETY